MQAAYCELEDEGEMPRLADVLQDEEMDARRGSQRNGLPGSARCCRKPGTGMGLPIAVTEAHTDAKREDQLRWLLEIWEASQLRKWSKAKS